MCQCKLLKTRFRKKLRSETQEEDIDGVSIRSQYKNCYESYVKCKGNIKKMRPKVPIQVLRRIIVA